jgi:DNA-binding transcriptional LysR family regulator
MNKLKAMEVFISVVEEGSFTGAAKKEDMSVVMVAKYINNLEKTLKTDLLQRTTRSMMVTSAGQLFYESAQGILANVNQAYEAMEGLNNEPQGLLRISAPMTVGKEIVGPIVAEFMQIYPQVRIELVLNNSVADLIAEGYDCAFRIGDLKDYALVAKPLFLYRMIICATPEYLRQHGTPTAPEALSQHRLLIHSTWNSRFAWNLREGGSDIAWPNNWVMKSNDGYALRDAALASNGILMQPHFLVKDEIASGRLVTLLEDFLPKPRPVHLLYAPKKNEVPKLDKFVQFVMQKCEGME